MTEVIKIQSLNIHKQSFKGILIKRCSEISRKFTGEHLRRSVISMSMQRATSKTWTLTLDLHPDKRGPLKTWTLKYMNPKKLGP